MNPEVHHQFNDIFNQAKEELRRLFKERNEKHSGASPDHLEKEKKLLELEHFLIEWINEQIEERMKAGKLGSEGDIDEFCLDIDQLKSTIGTEYKNAHAFLGGITFSIQEWKAFLAATEIIRQNTREKLLRTIGSEPKKDEGEPDLDLEILEIITANEYPEWLKPYEENIRKLLMIPENQHMVIELVRSMKETTQEVGERLTKDTSTRLADSVREADSLKATVKTLQRDLADTQNRLVLRDQSSVALGNAIASHLVTIDALRKRIDDETDAHASYKMTTDQSFEQMGQELDLARASVTVLEPKFREAEAALAGAKEVVSKKDEEISRLNILLEEAKKAAEQLESMVPVADLDEAYNQNLDYQRQIAEFNEDKTRKAEHILYQEDRLRILQQRISGLEVELKTIKAERSKFGDALEEAKAQFAKELSGKDEEIERITRESADKDVIASKLQEVGLDRAGELMHLEERLRVLEQLNVGLTHQLEAAKVGQEKFKGEVDVAGAELSKKALEISELKKSVEVAYSQNLALTEEVGRLKREGLIATQDAQEQDYQIRALKQDKVTLNTELAEKTAEFFERQKTLEGSLLALQEQIKTQLGTIQQPAEEGAKKTDTPESRQSIFNEIQSGLLENAEQKIEELEEMSTKADDASNKFEVWIQAAETGRTAYLRDLERTFPKAENMGEIAAQRKEMSRQKNAIDARIDGYKKNFTAVEEIRKQIYKVLKTWEEYAVALRRISGDVKLPGIPQLPNTAIDKIKDVPAKKPDVQKWMVAAVAGTEEPCFAVAQSANESEPAINIEELPFALREPTDDERAQIEKLEQTITGLIGKSAQDLHNTFAFNWKNDEFPDYKELAVHAHSGTLLANLRFITTVLGALRNGNEFSAQTGNTINRLLRSKEVRLAKDPTEASDRGSQVLRMAEIWGRIFPDLAVIQRIGEGIKGKKAVLTPLGEIASQVWIKNLVAENRLTIEQLKELHSLVQTLED